jgi:hypothetical protein
MQIPTAFGNQQQPYPQREPQPFGGAQQVRQPQAQPQPQHNQQPVSADASDGERLPSFITGAQPQNPQGFAPNGHDNQGGERFPRHRRRRHRGARPDLSPAGDVREDGSDDSRPGN